jgi:hypothetical protein
MFQRGCIDASPFLLSFSNDECFGRKDSFQMNQVRWECVRQMGGTAAEGFQQISLERCG